MLAGMSSIRAPLIVFALALLILGACNWNPRPGSPPLGPTPPGMAWIPQGTFPMGNDQIDDESPVHSVLLEGFWMDATEVTNAQFRSFVEATGYVTTAERAVDLDEIMAQLPEGTEPPPNEMLAPGSVVFTPPSRAVGLNNHSQWWSWVTGANWQHPEGPDSDLKGREDHPVVQVSWDDAVAYATWAGKRLPTEAEWERAARSTIEGKPFIWGDQPPDEAFTPANIWQGSFPDQNTATDGFEGTAPVASFPPNGYGLFDMGGNVWEWCSDWYRPGYEDTQSNVSPQGPATSFDPAEPTIPKRIMRGGSFLCSDVYCTGYRPSARMKSSPDTGLAHTGFRCAMDA